MLSLDKRLDELREDLTADPTDSILKHYRNVYDEIIQLSKSPREGIGVWVSGFFGSGKSNPKIFIALADSWRTSAG